MTSTPCGGAHHRAPVTLSGFREAAALTQQQAADRVGVTRQTIAAWEHGDRTPSGAQVMHLAWAYRLSVDDLLRAVGPTLRDAGSG